MALNVAVASVKLFARTGMWTVGLAGAVLGRAMRSSSDVLRSGMGSANVSQTLSRVTRQTFRYGVGDAVGSATQVDASPLLNHAVNVLKLLLKLHLL
jgi:uncharacterized protein YgiB involved in biofilm formation